MRRAVMAFCVCWLTYSAVQAQTAGASGSLAGKVVDPQDAPIPLVQIAATDESTGNRFEAKTDCLGEYQLPSLTPGKYTVRFERQGFKTENRPAIVNSAQTSQLDLKMRLSVCCSGPQVEAEKPVGPETKATGSLSGAVIDQTGAVVAGAKVTATWGERYETTTGPDGFYRFPRLPWGDYCMKFEAAGFNPETRTAVHIDPGKQATLNMRLTVGAAAERVIVCTGTCPIENIFIPPPHRGIALEVHLDESGSVGGSERWINVTLTNTAKHTIVVEGDRGLSPSFDYDIYAFGSCNCPGKLRLRHLMTNHTLKLRPGESISDKFDLTRLIDSTQADTYGVVVERPDTSTAENGAASREQPLVRSNVISVNVEARTSEQHK